MFISSVFVFGLATLSLAAPPNKRAVAFFDPTLGGGSMLDDASGGSSPSDLGEPLNVIISGLSSPAVLTDNGFLNFARAIGLGPSSTECLGIHLGGPQSANLGDGNGYVNQTSELRQDYGDAELGTCLESLIGGNHLRVYRQNGPTEDTGALFLAVSKEENVAEGHNIIPNGYNIGRDLLVQNATKTDPLPSFGGITYSATLQQLTGLLPAGSAGVNHGIATDGVTSLLTVTTVTTV
ncbi:Secreted protein [Mycena venus]|uniref:Secreted protein n=1 Tax=Mycena venus TaxID=2733690 RepID=A0A8H6YN20_9AGAR|nr:Secreted protein [Mycena venus]